MFEKQNLIGNRKKNAPKKTASRDNDALQRKINTDSNAWIVGKECSKMFAYI